MKKLITLVCLLGVFSLNTATAQCAKSAEAKASCCKSKAKGTASVETSEAMLVAMKEQNVEEKVCETSGTKSFFIKKVNLETSEASIQEVAFDEKMGKFINISPSKACNAKTAEEMERCKAKATASGSACCKAKATKDI